ncbi:MAG TPA: NADH-quinone oxidoreductase subunit N [Candidatus Methylomirabilis sp.]|nr:NADH-quinone oxidoreductase subunit N [Candidatus Methylomirabilis sp.]
MPGLGSPLVLEAGLGVLMLLVFFVGVFSRGADRRRVGVISAIGLVVLLAIAWRSEPGALFGGRFVQDQLAIFAKRLFLLATIIGVIGSLGLRAPSFARRATEYHLAILASLLGMLVLASARELILLFVAFELMSIPLYYLAGFLKREEEAVEAALKFFLVGTVSSAIMAYGLSFLYGVTGTTDLLGVASVIQRSRSVSGSILMLGMMLTLGGLGFKIAAFPFHMWVPDTYEAASTPFVAWLSVAPKAAGFVVIFRIYLEGLGDRVVLWVPVATGLAAITIVAGNLMAIPQQNIKRLLAYSGIAHIGYMLVGFAAVSANGVAMMLFYLVAYLFGNMGAFLVVEAVGQSEGSDSIAAYRGLAQRSPVLALSMLLFLLSLGGIPFVAGFWAKLYVFWAAAERGLYWLVLVGAVLTVVALFYYLLIAKRMYIDAPATTTPVPVTPFLTLSIFLCVVGVVGMGLYPKPFVMAALRAAAPLF